MTRARPHAPSSIELERFASQLLVGSRKDSAIDVTAHVLALQAQDPRGMRLAFRPRSHGLSACDIDDALDSRSLILTTLNRGTLHLICAEDYHWLHALTAPTVMTANATRLRQEGVSVEQAERGVTTIETALANDGPLTRPQLKARLQAKGIHVEGQALPHLLLLASLRGLTVRGPMVGAEQAHVLVRDWLRPPKRALERDHALAELARRYLRGHGPATHRDLAKWSGLPLRDTRRGFELIANELDERDGADRALKRAPRGELPPPLLLGAFDPLLHGWVSRADLLGAAGKGIVTSNGPSRPFALVEGRAAGTWSLPKGRVVLEPFAPLDRAVSAALSDEAKRVERFVKGS